MFQPQVAATCGRCKLLCVNVPLAITVADDTLGHPPSGCCQRWYLKAGVQGLTLGGLCMSSLFLSCSILFAQAPPGPGSNPSLCCAEIYWYLCILKCIHGIEWNVFWMSMLTAAPNWHFLIADASFFSFQATSIVDWLTQNTYWSALRAHFPWKCFLSHSTLACSKIFLDSI